MINETGIEIADYILNGYNLKFKVSGFKIGKSKITAGQKTGFVRISVKLINDKSEVIYETANTLKSRENAIDISLNLPAKFAGYFKLTIETIDLISIRDAKIDKYIKLQWLTFFKKIVINLAGANMKKVIFILVFLIVVCSAYAGEKTYSLTDMMNTISLN